MNIQINPIERLQQFGIKPSLQRIAVMNYLLKNYNHPTVDMIFSSLYEFIPTLSKTTVYNTLKLLAQQGVIMEITIDEKNVRYDGDISQHAHFQCKNCGCIRDIHIKNTETISDNETGDLLITESQLYYKGYCEECKKKVS
jgi:Fur family ferric uptake transcriptional regulator/Fur family peroxide stress response transcriptional regulator